MDKEFMRLECLKLAQNKTNAGTRLSSEEDVKIASRYERYVLGDTSEVDDISEENQENEAITV